MLDCHDEPTHFSPADDAWDVFELDSDAEAEPEHGDFWGVLDDDCDDADWRGGIGR